MPTPCRRKDAPSEAGVAASVEITLTPDAYDARLDIALATAS